MVFLRKVSQVLESFIMISKFAKYSEIHRIAQKKVNLVLEVLSQLNRILPDPNFNDIREIS
jgi:hypothetical protein